MSNILMTSHQLYVPYPRPLAAYMACISLTAAVWPRSADRRTPAAMRAGAATMDPKCHTYRLYSQFTVVLWQLQVTIPRTGPVAHALCPRSARTGLVYPHNPLTPCSRVPMAGKRRRGRPPLLECCVPDCKRHCTGPNKHRECRLHQREAISRTDLPLYAVVSTFEDRGSCTQEQTRQRAVTAAGKSLQSNALAYKQMLAASHTEDTTFAADALACARDIERRKQGEESNAVPLSARMALTRNALSLVADHDIVFQLRRSYLAHLGEGIKTKHLAGMLCEAGVQDYSTPRRVADARRRANTQNLMQHMRAYKTKKRSAGGKSVSPKQIAAIQKYFRDHSYELGWMGECGCAPAHTHTHTRTPLRRSHRRCPQPLCARRPP